MEIEEIASRDIFLAKSDDSNIVANHYVPVRSVTLCYLLLPSVILHYRHRHRHRDHHRHWYRHRYRYRYYETVTFLVTLTI